MQSIKIINDNTIFIKFCKYVSDFFNETSIFLIFRLVFTPLFSETCKFRLLNHTNVKKGRGDLFEIKQKMIIYSMYKSSFVRSFNSKFYI